MIEFKEVTKKFPDGTKAVNNVSFRVEPGEFFVLIGPSGCGKTTTMKMINRLIDASEGTISIREEDILTKDMHKLRWEIGYVLQQIALFPHMSIAENIAIVPELKKWDKKRINERIDELMNMVGLDPGTYRDRLPKELSGGQQQRVGVVRALAGNPDILLMDEPFSALDPLSREQLQKDIGSLQKEIQKTVVFVTHDIDEALLLGDRIAVMQEGEVVQIATPDEILDAPANDFVRSFVGERKNLWKEKVKEAMNPQKTPGSGSGFSIEAEATLEDAVKLLKDKQAEVLDVKRSGNHAGSLSYKDIVSFLERFDKNTVKEGADE
ncbi:ABC transporter ATP-binding protein [Alkalicoccus halolimnae]|uniref:Quaternary amine transport ATP-binding protein n=1 Tax=Alkalicoccus halolimnae TaxID=1667239 RepID=A0A5C7FIV5_9BACI|nr:ABC transporter ATP-binding protein [Alkalicoccus halolimnae]TXF87257.1 ABC transporter ATP-binding protein [Alkalicoccus halolimnae]